MGIYLTVDDINLREGSKCVPPLFLLFIKFIVRSKLKQLAVSECIVQAARPLTVLSPLLLGLSVSLDHAFGSICYSRNYQDRDSAYHMIRFLG